MGYGYKVGSLEPGGNRNLASITASLHHYQLPQIHSENAGTHGSCPVTGAQPEVATFAAGCFWGAEHIFLKHYPIAQNKGIVKTSVGYTGGKAASTNPDYKTVCTGSTEHAEALRIEFDPSIVKYDELVGEYYMKDQMVRA